MHLEEVAMFDSLFRKFQLPIASLIDTLCAITFAFSPSVEVAYKIYCSSIRCPFAEHPSALCFVQTIILMSIGKIRKFCLSIICQ